MDSRELALEFKKKFPDMIIGSIMDSGNDLIVYLIDPSNKPGEFTTDSEYLYNKSKKTIKPFRYKDDPELYRRAERHIVYMRPGLRDE